MSSGNCILRTITSKDKILSNVSAEKRNLLFSCSHCKIGHRNDINVVIKVSISDTCALGDIIMSYTVTFVKTLQFSLNEVRKII